MKHLIIKLSINFLILGVLVAVPRQVLAQDETPEATEPDLTLSTTYPSQVVEMGESITLKLKVGAVVDSQTVQLMMDEIPDGWTATFRGGGRIIDALFVEANSSEFIDLRIDPPENQEPGEYSFLVLVEGDRLSADLPLTLNVEEKLPANLAFSIELPTIKGSPTTTFSFSAQLQNSGDEELEVNLAADTPTGFLSRFRVSAQEVTSFTLGANETKAITIELDPIVDFQAGSYPFTVYATGGDLQASLDLTAEVIGQQVLSISGLDGRLSGRANAGSETTLPIVVLNTGSAPAQGVEMSATSPSGWSVSFDPEVIAEVPSGGQVEVTAILTPADKAVAGDYMVTMRAQPIGGASESAEFRITVTTSTLWGVAGIALIAVAVGVVALAVMRFGRR